MMKRKSSASENNSITDVTVAPGYSPLKFRLVMIGGLVALVFYWFYFILGGTFDPAKRANLKRTTLATQRFFASSTQKPAKAASRKVAASMQSKPAIKGGHSAQIRQSR